jgi:NitT/TauT family transport system ATP-binding protein
VTVSAQANLASDAPAPANVSPPAGGLDPRPPCVSAHGVRHVFPDGTVALDGIDLDIATCSFVAILGPSGCGKSTLLRLISGLEQPTSGRLAVLGQTASGATSRAPQAAGPTRAGPAGLAFVFQDAHLLPWRSVLENVALPLELRKVSRSDARTRAEAAVADVELSDSASRFPDELSGGMRMRVSIARALVTEPRLLLMDEPFAALDELTRQRLDERLRELWTRRRMTVLFVTHSLSEAVFLSDRAVVMSRRPGRVVLDHPVDLPSERAGWMRTELPFSRQMAILREALETHGTSNDGRS